MSLDKRIIKGKKPLSYFDSEQGYEFIGKECYFSDIACKYEDLDDIENSDNYVNCTKGTLSCVNIYDKEDRVFENKETAVIYRYCLPCEWVKQTEKKYRPYTMNEFANDYSLGDEVIIRRKEGNCEIEHKLFTEYVEDDTDVCFGVSWFSLDNLFDNYELYTCEGWTPFGVLES